MHHLGITRHDLIIADSAEPKSITEINRLGFNVKPAYKGPDSIQSGINNLKQYEVYMHEESSNLHHEVDLHECRSESVRYDCT